MKDIILSAHISASIENEVSPTSNDIWYSNIRDISQAASVARHVTTSRANDVILSSPRSLLALHVGHSVEQGGRNAEDAFANCVLFEQVGLTRSARSLNSSLASQRGFR